MKICVYGGQFGSEGKGSVAEILIKGPTRSAGKKLAVFGENSPNSGHTNSVGKTRNVPVSAFFADAVIMGPDSVISPECLVADLQAILAYRAANDLTNVFQVYIHENAALCNPSDSQMETGMVERVSSTGSGSGWARTSKFFYRDGVATIGGSDTLRDAVVKAGISVVSIVNTNQYLSLVDGIFSENHDCVFECSQGALLDPNFGYFPYVTTRTTLARVAIERNGLGGAVWDYVGVYRTYPIRTGGPSGPTGGQETTFEKIGVPSEQATVTKRIRRVFEFSKSDFLKSLMLNRPDVVAFTHLDYLGIDPGDFNAFFGWLTLTESEEQVLSHITWILSNTTGKGQFHE